MTTRKRKPPVRRRPQLVASVDPETLAAIDQHAAELAGETGIPSRSAAIDDLVKIAATALGRDRDPNRA